MADTSRSNDNSAHPVLNATRARQGRFGRHMFWVLVAGTAAFRGGAGAYAANIAALKGQG